MHNVVILCKVLIIAINPWQWRVHHIICEIRVIVLWDWDFNFCIVTNSVQAAILKLGGHLENGRFLGGPRSFFNRGYVMNISWKSHACIIKWSIFLDFLTKLLHYIQCWFILCTTGRSQCVHCVQSIPFQTYELQSR